MLDAAQMQEDEARVTVHACSGDGARQDTNETVYSAVMLMRMSPSDMVYLSLQHPHPGIMLVEFRVINFAQTSLCHRCMLGDVWRP
jgi:hypothetical protein